MLQTVNELAEDLLRITGTEISERMNPNSLNMKVFCINHSGDISARGIFSIAALLLIGSGCEDAKSNEILHALSSPVVIDGSSDLQNVFTPCDLAVAPDGKLFILDMLQMTVFVLDSEGNYLYEFGGPGEGPGEFDSILFNFDLSMTGEVYTINNRNLIEVFSGEGNYLRRIETGTGQIFDLAVADSNRLYFSGHPLAISLLDMNEGPAVIQIDSLGEVVREYGCVQLDQRSVHERKMLLSCVLDIDEDCSVYCSSVSEYCVFKYDSVGTEVWSVQGESSNRAYAVSSEESGSMLYPVIWDLDVYGGLVYVLWAQDGEERGYRVDVFDSETGEFMGYFFTDVPSETMNMCIEVNGDHFFTIDYDNALIYRYILSTDWPGD